MADIIEICGAPGVGKSTIFEAIRKLNNKNDRWETVSIFNPFGEETGLGFFNRVLKASLIENGKTVPNKTLINRLKLSVREFKKGRNYVDPISLKEAGDRFAEEFPDYLDACWNNIYFKQKYNLNGRDLRFEKADFMYRIIKKIQVIREKRSNKYVVIDEGLINLIDRALYKGQNDEEEIKSLINNMPKPKALIHLDINIEEHIRRLNTRPDVRDMHKNLSNRDLEIITEKSKSIIKTAVQIMENSGTPVLYLDSENSVEPNIDRIKNFIESLELELPDYETNKIISENAY